MEHFFGGEWTEIKLEVLRKYLHFYTQALKNTHFELLYIDAFAGTGYRDEKQKKVPSRSTSVCLQEELDIPIEPTPPTRHDGSAKIALEIERPFDRYLFIEKKKKRYQALMELEKHHPDKYIKVRNDDANTVLQEICGNKSSWEKKKYRGVVFLDPYGNSVKWETLQALASTKSLDIWFLFPLSGVYRQTPHDHDKLDESKRQSLNGMFGTNEWEKAFYYTVTDTLFEFEETKRISVDRIETWVRGRLSQCFPHVAKPLRIHNNNTPYFSLFFCASNPSPKAYGLALKAANHILKKQKQ